MPASPATRGSAHRPRSARIGCPASMNGNYSTSPEEESATGRPDRDPLATQDDPAKFLTQDNAVHRRPRTPGWVVSDIQTPCLPLVMRGSGSENKIANGDSGSQTLLDGQRPHDCGRVSSDHRECVRRRDARTEAIRWRAKQRRIWRTRRRLPSAPASHRFDLQRIALRSPAASPQ
jgi:hypothetical protein